VEKHAGLGERGGDPYRKAGLVTWEGTPLVHVQDRLQLGGAEVGQAVIAPDPCVVDQQHVYRAEGA